MISQQPDIIFMVIMWTALAAVGACMGSFASAMSYRIEQGKSWIQSRDKKSGKSVAARSCCPDCGHQLSWIDLVPILSWVASHGRCRYCHRRISIKYPLVEGAGMVAMLLFFQIESREQWLLLFIMALPFSLAFGMLIINRVRPPLYVWCGLLIDLSLVIICGL